MNEAGRPLSASARKVQEAIAAAGFDRRVFELEVPVRTSAEAAREVGCEVAQIAKSLIFRGTTTGRPVFVIASGANRVDEAKLAALIGEPIGRADPAFVRDVTGYAIGGIPPLGHAQPLEPLVDEDLMRHETIWAAAGHPNALFETTPRELVAMSRGVVAKVAM